MSFDVKHFTETPSVSLSQTSGTPLACFPPSKRELLGFKPHLQKNHVFLFDGRSYFTRIIRPQFSHSTYGAPVPDFIHVRRRELHVAAAAAVVVNPSDRRGGMALDGLVFFQQLRIDPLCLLGDCLLSASSFTLACLYSSS